MVDSFRAQFKTKSRILIQNEYSPMVVDLIFDPGHVPPAQAAPESQVRQQVFSGRKQFP